jgi:exopolyphosphatase/pppGpp-phosphohydrolase
MHGIGAGLDAKAPAKAARKFLRDMPVPPGWTETQWKLLAEVVRYHRGAEPKAKHKTFARMDEREQYLVRAMAGILRLARVLRKCGVQSTVGLRVEKSVEAWIVCVPGLEDTQEIAISLAAGKHLLESGLRKPLIVKSVPGPLHLVELPNTQEVPEPAKAASASAD